MTDLKEYVVTLHDRGDLEAFYDDMETPGGNLYIPDRSVDLALRRPNSRNTHYWLTTAEAEQIRLDPRVLACDLKPSELGIKVRPFLTQTSSFFNKSASNNANHTNWALLRCTEGVQRSGWGSDATANQSGTITLNATGRNVDVVVVDGMINPAHPEYAVNADGTGGSRVVQYNWLQHDLGSGTGTYVYTPYTDAGNADRTADNNHGAHVAGTLAGNTQGWARSANIYNINPYSTDPNNLNDELLFDYIRAFHNNKPTNPVTGRPNPTICNNSWGYSYELDITQITNIYYRGSYVGGAPYSQATLLNYGIFSSGGYAYTLARYAAVEADIIDAMTDGIIMVGAAGNSYAKIDVPGGLDYDNFYVYSGFGVYYHRGGAPSSTPNLIEVGAVGSTSAETKAAFSMTGPGVDVYAPGQNIISSFNSASSYGGVQDSRNASYVQGKISGTSMASPQVCGVLACVLETYPHYTQADLRTYLLSYAGAAQITDTAGSYSDYTSLQGGSNRYLYYVPERGAAGVTWPKQNYGARSSGWPRPKRRLQQF